MSTVAAAAVVVAAVVVVVVAVDVFQLEPRRKLKTMMEKNKTKYFEKNSDADVVVVVVVVVVDAFRDIFLWRLFFSRPWRPGKSRKVIFDVDVVYGKWDTIIFRLDRVVCIHLRRRKRRSRRRHRRRRRCCRH